MFIQLKYYDIWLTAPAENPKSDELSENKDDGDKGSGFKLNAGHTQTEYNYHMLSTTICSQICDISQQKITLVTVDRINLLL